MPETVVVTDSSTVAATVTVYDVGSVPAHVVVSDVAMLSGMQLDRSNSVQDGAQVDNDLWYRLWELSGAIALTNVDAELPTGLVPAPYFQLVGGRILMHCEGPVPAAFASTLIFKLQATKAGVTTLLATFTSTALAGGASVGHWSFDLQVSSIGNASQRLKGSFEYQAASGAKVRETFWVSTSYAFDADVYLRLDGAVGAGTLDVDVMDAYHLGRRTGSW